jgi:hypothetical protein
MKVMFFRFEVGQFVMLVHSQEIMKFEVLFSAKIWIAV